jgi:hypothetical protein
MGFRIVPQRFRFAFAVSIARAVVPLFRLTAAYREQSIRRFHNSYEISLHLVLNALTKNGTAFDPIIVVKGYDEFERARRAGKGVLVIGHHAALTLLMVRFFYDKGLDPIVLTPDPDMRVGGSQVIVRTVQPSPTFLLKIRSSLRRAEVICAMPDRAEPVPRRTIDFVIENRRLIVAPAIMQVAARCGARVIFAEVHANRGRLMGTLAAPSNSTAVNEVTDEFVAFVQATTGSTAAIGA